MLVLEKERKEGEEGVQRTRSDGRRTMASAATSGYQPQQ